MKMVILVFPIEDIDRNQNIFNREGNIIILEDQNDLHSGSDQMVFPIEDINRNQNTGRQCHHSGRQE